MTGHTRRRPVALALAAVVTAATVACGSSQPASNPPETAHGSAIPRGGNLVASVRSEPRSFNRLAARDSSTDLVTNLTQAKLVRINRVTQEVEPWLAESWTRSPDARRYTLKLRQGVVFSDGQPFTSADVVFMFKAIYDEKTASNLADSLTANHKRLRVTAIDPHTVEIVFAEPFAAGVRLLDNLLILPRHKLEPALDAGQLGNAWNVATPPSDIVGLGPFVLSSYVPGQRLVFDRNPRYFRKAPDGGALPYLDHLTVEILGDQNAELLRLEAGQIDTMETAIGPEAYAPLKRAADAGRVTLYDLGVSLVPNSLWFNLEPGAFASDPRAAWLQRDELRQAISLAVDRKLFADTVYLGAAVAGPRPDHARRTRSGTGRGCPRRRTIPKRRRRRSPPSASPIATATACSRTRATRRVRFTLLTQGGRPELERGVAVVRDELKKIGVIVDVVSLEASALLDRFANTKKYDAVYWTVNMTDTDPAINPDFWFSSGNGRTLEHGAEDARPPTGSGASTS